MSEARIEPTRFRVGLTAAGPWHGGGFLTVAPGWLVASPSRLTARVSGASEVRHESDRVDIYIARLVPPWFSITVPVRGQGQILAASIWLLARRKLRRTLREAGFEVVEHITWVYGGYRYAELGPLGFGGRRRGSRP